MSETREPVVKLTLPYPPSINRYWRHVGTRVLISKAGRRYRSDVAAVLTAERVKPLEGELAVQIDVFPPDRRRRDLDNTLKALLDAMQGGAYVDDNQIGELHVERHHVEKPGKVVVQIWSRFTTGV